MTNSVDSMRVRLARYYLGRLRSADLAYRRGHVVSDSLSVFSQDWPQIAQFQSWVASQHQHDAELARLCAAFPQAGAEVLITRQTPQERLAWLEVGLAAARTLGDRQAEAQCLFRMAWAIHKQALLEPAEQVARQALACAEAIADRLLTGQCLHLLGEITVRRGDFEASEPFHRRSMALLQRIDARAALADVYFSLSEIVYFRGDYAQARDLSLQCYQIHLALGINPATTNNLTCVGIYTAEAGDLEQGIAYLQHSIALCRQSHAQSTLAHALKNYANLLFVRRELPAAAQLIDESLQLAELIGEAWLIPDILIFKGRIHAARGDYAIATRAAEQAVTIAHAMQYQLTLLEALISQADVLVYAGAHSAAALALREGLRLAVAFHTIVHTLYALYVAARLYAACGNRSLAVQLVGMLLHETRADAAVRQSLPELSTMLRTQLGEQQYAAAVERGHTMTLEQAVAMVLDAPGRAQRTTSHQQ